MRSPRLAGSNQSQSVTSPDDQQAHYDLRKKSRRDQACIHSPQTRTSPALLPTRLLFGLIRRIVRCFQGVPQATLPTTVYVAAGCPLSRWPLTKVWSTRRVERSRLRASGVSPVNV